MKKIFLALAFLFTTATFSVQAAEPTKEQLAQLEAATMAYIERTECAKKMLLEKGYDIKNITEQELNLINSLKEAKSPCWKSI